MKYIDYVFNCLMDLCMFITKIILLGMTAIICISVFYRYVLNTGIRWSDEVAMMLMVYIGFISMAYGVKEHLHLGVEIFYNKFPLKMQQIVNKACCALISVLGVVLTVYGVLLIKSTMNNVMTATRWPAATLYAVVPVSGILIAYFSFAELIGYQSTYKKEGGTDE